MNKEVIIEMLDNKLLIMEELKQVQASIFNGEVKSIMLFIENQQQKLDKYKNNIERIQSIYTSMQFSAPENMYVFIDQLGEILEELKGSDKEWIKKIA